MKLTKARRNELEAIGPKRPHSATLFVTPTDFRIRNVAPLTYDEFESLLQSAEELERMQAQLALVDAKSTLTLKQIAELPKRQFPANTVAKRVLVFPGYTEAPCDSPLFLVVVTDICNRCGWNEQAHLDRQGKAAPTLTEAIGNMGVSCGTAVPACRHGVVLLPGVTCRKCTHGDGMLPADDSEVTLQRREYAKAAMTGFISNMTYGGELQRIFDRNEAIANEKGTEQEEPHDYVARLAFSMAEAMLRHQQTREKG